MDFEIEESTTYPDQDPHDFMHGCLIYFNAIHIHRTMGNRVTEVSSFITSASGSFLLLSGPN
jgi:hypothetical protein